MYCVDMREEARDWFDAAKVDLEEARSALREGRHNWACFAAHQCVEKVLKAAIMVLKRERPPKTHDLTRLLHILGIDLGDELRRTISELSPYYTIARYPNAGLERPWESIDRATAEKFVKAAEEILRKIGELLGFH